MANPCERVLPTMPMEAFTLKDGDVLRYVAADDRSPGNLSERDPEHVFEHVVDEKVSIEAGRESRAMIIDLERLVIGAPAAAARREALTP